jgi:molybdopterin-containing oxidoreductase family membrane subunit
MTAMKNAREQQKINDAPWLNGMIVLVIIGAIAWAVQLIQGMSVTGVGPKAAWGAYVVTFFFLVGGASGFVILASLADLQIIPDLQSQRRTLLLGALAGYMASGLAIMLDIGKIFRVLNMVFSAHLRSPFMWDFICVMLGMAVTAYYLLGPKKKWLPVLAGIVAVMVVIVEGLILNMSAGVSLWHDGSIPLVFLIEGVMTASAITLIAQGDSPASSDVLRGILLVLLPLVFVLQVVETATVFYAGDPDAQTATTLILSSPLHWGVLILGVIVPFVLLLQKSRTHAKTTTAAGLLILGVFGAKWITVVYAQAVHFMQKTALYSPTLVEVAGVVGVMGLAGVLFLLGMRYVPKNAI